MAASKGSSFLIKKGEVVICAGIQSKDIKYNGEPIDISGDDDAGWRALMSETGMKSIDIAFEGISKDAILRTVVLNDARMLSDVKLVWKNGDELSGNFFLANFSEKGETNDAIKFSAELQSSGAMVFTAAVPGP